MKDRLAAQYGGRVIEAEQENDDVRARYEVKLMDADGRRHKILVDRQSSEILRAGR